MINLIYDITNPASIYDCISSPIIIGTQFIELENFLYKNIIKQDPASIVFD